MVDGVNDYVEAGDIKVNFLKATRSNKSGPCFTVTTNNSP